MLPIPPSLIIFDFDGVFTDNSVYVMENGAEAVRCSRSDGLGISMLLKQNIPMFILSTEENPVVSARAKKLKINVFQGCKDKASFLMDYFHRHQIDVSRSIYVGNDVNDLEAMRLASFSACPADADDSVKNVASVILNKNGGNGAVRELCDKILKGMTNYQAKV